MVDYKKAHIQFFSTVVSRIHLQSSKDMASAEQKPQITQHTFNGVLYDSVFPAEVLQKIQDFKFDSSDVLVAGYPKTGEFYRPLYKDCKVC